VLKRKTHQFSQLGLPVDDSVVRTENLLEKERHGLGDWVSNVDQDLRRGRNRQVSEVWSNETRCRKSDETNLSHSSSLGSDEETVS